MFVRMRKCCRQCGKNTGQKKIFRTCGSCRGFLEKKTMTLCKCGHEEHCKVCPSKHCLVVINERWHCSGFERQER